MGGLEPGPKLNITAYQNIWRKKKEIRTIKTKQERWKIRKQLTKTKDQVRLPINIKQLNYSRQKNYYSYK